MIINYVIFDCWDTVVTYGYKDKSQNYAELKNVYKHVVDKSKVSFEAFCAFKEKFIRQYYFETIYDVNIEALLAYIVEAQSLKLDCSYKKAADDMVKAYSDELVPGLKDFCAFLKEKGIASSVLSNTVLSQKHTIFVIRRAWKDNPFERIMASSYYAVKKPDPRFYELGALKAGVKPEACLFIGDNMHTDIKGAHLAHMHPILLNWKKKEWSEEDRAAVGDFDEVQSYDELKGLIERNDKYELRRP